MIKNKQKFILSIFFILLIIIINFPFPDQIRLGEKILSSLFAFIHPNDIGKLTGFLSVVLIIFSVILFNQSIQKFKATVTFLLLIGIFISPQLLVQAYQHTIANGVYAIVYDKEKSQCTYEVLNDELNVRCDIFFRNFSNKDVEFNLSFTQGDFEEAKKLYAVILKDISQAVKIEKNSQQSVVIEKKKKLSNENFNFLKGNMSFVDIIIWDDHKKRIL